MASTVVGVFLGAVGLVLYGALQIFIVDPWEALTVRLEPWSGQFQLMLSFFFAAAIWIGFFTAMAYCIKGMRILLDMA